MGAYLNVMASRLGAKLKIEVVPMNIRGKWLLEDGLWKMSDSWANWGIWNF